MSDRTYFVSVPNVLLDIDLSENALRLYLRIKRHAGDRGGICNEKIATLAAAARMGKAQAIAARDELARPREELGGLALIEVVETQRAGCITAHAIRVVDVWPENMARYSAARPESLTGSESNPARVLNGTGTGSEWNPERVLNGTALKEQEQEQERAHVADAPCAPVDGADAQGDIHVAGDRWVPFFVAVALDLTGRANGWRTRRQPTQAFTVYRQLAGVFGALCDADVDASIAAWHRFVAEKKAARFRDSDEPVWRGITSRNVVEHAQRWCLDSPSAKAPGADQGAVAMNFRWS